MTDAEWTVIDSAFSVNDEPTPGLAPRQEFDALFRLIIAMAPPPIGIGPTARTAA